MEAARGLRALVLDFDGVVVDSMGMQERAWDAAITAVLDPPGSATRERLIQNLYAGKAGPRIFDGADVSDEHRAALRAFKDDVWQQMWPRVKLMEGAEEVIPRLAGRFVLAIATSSTRRYVHDCLGASLLSHVQEVLTDADVDAPKPAPDLLDRIAERTGIGPDATCMVGDTVTDLEMARRAGVSDFIAFRVHGRWADAPAFEGVEQVDDWYELDELLGG